MKTQHFHITSFDPQALERASSFQFSPDLVFVFSSAGDAVNRLLTALKSHNSASTIIGCSTAGEISGTGVYDKTATVTAVKFEKTQVKVASAQIESVEKSFDVGVRLADELSDPKLKHIFVLSDGLKINGSALTRGFSSRLSKEIILTGGLAGDGDRFVGTQVYVDANASSNQVTAVGLYGSAIHVGAGSLGGWDVFGPERTVTKSEGNVLYEMDGRSALEIYKTYLGPQADGLPATGLLFPLSLVTENEQQQGLVRTILAIDEERGSITFAGDIPTQSVVRMMKANFERLIDGASGAAHSSMSDLSALSPELAILVSCVGRKMILQQRVEEEVEAVREVLGPSPILTGFYSYGEISPFTPTGRCELHNQTMTITAWAEK
jgi:hypothetical protein